MPKKEEHGGPTPSFQESAKKFKPGPLAPPERDEDRPDMSGGTHAAADRPDHARAAAAMTHPAPTVREEAAMTDGMPGQLGHMPGETEEG